jgi:hypothetical protein
MWGISYVMVERLLALFPGVSSPSAADRRAFAVELFQAAQTRDMAQLTELLEDWQATAEALSNPRFMRSWQSPDHIDGDIPLEQVRGELDSVRDAEAGRP